MKSLIRVAAKTRTVTVAVIADSSASHRTGSSAWREWLPSWMSAYGTEPTFRNVRAMSAIAGNSDIQPIALKGRD